MCITKKGIKFKSLYCVKRPGEFNEVIIDTNDAAAVINEIRWWQRYCNDIKNTSELINLKVKLNSIYGINSFGDKYFEVCEDNRHLKEQNESLKKENERLTYELGEANKDTFIMQHFTRPNGTQFSTNSVEGLINEIEYCYGVIEQYSKELSKMEEKYDNRYEEVESLKKENEELKCNYDAISHNFDIVHEKNIKLEKENKKLKDELDAEKIATKYCVTDVLVTENNMLRKDNCDLKKENEDLKKELEKARTSNNICLNRIKELGEELSEFKRPNSINEFKKTSTYINRLEAEMKTLEQNVVEYEKEVESLKKENGDLKAEIEVLKRKLKVCEWDKRDLKDELEKLIKDYLG